MSSYFIFIINKENWEIVKKKEVMGLGGLWGGRFYPKIKENDKCVIYIIKESVFSGIFEIISRNFNQKIKWNTGEYEYIFKLKRMIIPNKPVLVKEHINKLNFIRNKNNWHCYFRFPKSIEEEDFKYISSIME